MALPSTQRPWLALLFYIAFASLAATPALAQAGLPRMQCSKIALLKTHKTGSSIMGGLLFRVAAQQGLRIFPAGGGIDLNAPRTPEQQGQFDMALHYIKGGCLPPGRFGDVLEFYQSIFGTSNFTLIVNVRDPAYRYLAHFYTYGTQVVNGSALVSDLSKRANVNVLSCALGVYTQDHLFELMQHPLYSRIMFVPLDMFPLVASYMVKSCGWGDAHGYFLRPKPKKLHNPVDNTTATISGRCHWGGRVGLLLL